MHSRPALTLAFAGVAALLLVASCGDDGGSAALDAGSDGSDLDGPAVDGPDPDGPDPDGPIDAMPDTMPPNTVCTVTAGDTRKLVTGTLLTPTGVVANGQVAISAAGVITCVGTACAAGGETVIACPNGVISPGLINTHDHLTFSQNAPYTDSGERYEHRHDWRLGRRGHTQINIAGGATSDMIRWGELRFLFGGATSIVGAGGASGLLRNLDQASNQEGLGQPAVRFESFPLDDAAGTQITGTCNYGAAADTSASIAELASYLPRIAEGIDDVSRNEFLCTSSTTYDVTSPGVSTDLVQPQTAIVHGIGLRPSDYGVMALDDTALLWSPRSDIRLYGDTALAPVATRMGVQIALGTNWTATGSMNLLRELDCADFVNRTYWSSYFPDQALWAMVTGNAAEVTATGDAIGAIVVGRVADLSIFDGRVNLSYRAVIDAEPKDVVLVMRGGKPLYGEATTIAALTPSGCDEVDVCGNPKRVCLMGEIGLTYAQLAAVSGNSYPAFFCGAPPTEPLCVPRRPTAVAGSTTYTGAITASDDDGDGIADSTDSCPTVFNPIRPLDSGVQGNADGDADGDECDVCPVNADTTTCTAVNPDDRDGDGVINAIDNCPDNVNPLQEDGDGDFKGDVCDPCPLAANPGNAGCPATIYSIKNGTIPIGAVVRVQNAIVTGEGSTGLFVQVKETLANGMPDPAYLGPDNSGLFISTGAPSPLLAMVAPGNRVTIDGSVTLLNGQTALDSISAIAADPAIEGPPAPTLVTAAEVTSGGSRAATLESVLVRIGASTVTAINVAQGELTVMDAAGSVVVDDFLFVPVPTPTMGETFAHVTGVLALRGTTKIEPRSAADLPPSAAVITGFGPALSFVNVGQTMVPTHPTPLTVTLNGPAAITTMVNVVSSNTAAVMVVSPLVIGAGASSGQVLVSGMGAGTATLTASLATGPASTAAVRALDGTEQPMLVSLTPASANLAPSGTLALTVTLDLPAPVGGTVVSVALTPVTAGTVPATVTVLTGQLIATFNYVHSGSETAANVVASLGAASFTAAITITVPPVGLMINEVDYDQNLTDSVEYVELYNPTGATISLTNISLILVNGNATPAEYKRIDLGPAGSILAGGYLVIGAAAVTAQGAGVKYTPPLGTGPTQWPATDAIQNGGTPGDGMLIVNTATMTVLDKLSYESAITVTITGFGSINLVEGTFTTAGDDPIVSGSMVRIPSGTDTNNAQNDWAFSTTLTPGIANVP